MSTCLPQLSTRIWSPTHTHLRTTLPEGKRERERELKNIPPIRKNDTLIRAVLELAHVAEADFDKRPQFSNALQANHLRDVAPKFDEYLVGRLWRAVDLREGAVGALVFPLCCLCVGPMCGPPRGL